MRTLSRHLVWLGRMATSSDDSECVRLYRSFELFCGHFAGSIQQFRISHFALSVQSNIALPNQVGIFIYSTLYPTRRIL
jgi:hypothetical protein